MKFEYILKPISLTILLIISVQNVFAQTVRDVYDLDMKMPKENVRWSWLIYANWTSFTLDSNETVKGKPALKILSRRRIGDPHEASFQLMKTIPLPEWTTNKASAVTVRCKNKDMKNLKLSVMGIDENEDIQFSDSLFLTKNSWKKYNITFTQKNIKALRISLSSEEHRLKDMQTAWIDKVSINIGGKTIDDIPMEDLYPKVSSELNKDYVIPLSSQQNDKNFPKIFSGNPYPKIIGLGESSHGCQEIKEANYQLMKTLISRFGYTTIIAERAIDLSLTCDLYIRGLLRESYENQIQEESKGYFDDYLSFFNFLRWLREYNKTAARKVRLFGCNKFLNKQTGLFEYFEKISNKENPNFPYYLQKIGEGQYQAVRNRVINDTILKTRMDFADYHYLIFLLEKEELDFERKFRNPSYNRDEDMWIVTKKIIDTYMPGNEKAIVVAHSAHISKYTSFLDVNLNKPTLGNYISNKYKKDYFAISFQVGEGSSTQDEGSMYGETMIQFLQKAPKSSFEHKSLQTGLDYFYYPAKQLPQDIMHLRILLRTGRYLDQFYFCSIKKYFDGLVFLKRSHHLDHIESYPAFYVNGLIQGKQQRMREEMEKQGIKLEKGYN